MRLDKFLKVSRVIKRRTVSKDLALAGRVESRGVKLKPSYEVKVGDELLLDLGDRRLKIRILQLKDSARKEEVDSMYEVIQEEVK